MIRFITMGVFALLALHTQVLAQTTTQTPQPAQERYLPFPSNFEQYNEETKQKILKSVDDNTEKYFHSADYRALIANFMAQANPLNLNDCKNLAMNKQPGSNTINIIDTILFARADDRHPLVGKWTQKVSLHGCDQQYSFILTMSANKAQPPIIDLKN